MAECAKGVSTDLSNNFPLPQAANFMIPSINVLDEPEVEVSRSVLPPVYGFSSPRLRVRVYARSMKEGFF